MKLHLTGYKCNAPTYALRISTDDSTPTNRYIGDTALAERLAAFIKSSKAEHQFIYCWTTND